MLIKQNRGFTVIHALLALILVGGLVFIGFEVKHTIAVAKEKQAYSEADVQITSFVNDAAKLAPSTNKVTRYCSNSSEVYAQGSLGCVIRGEVDYSSSNSASDINRVMALEKKLQWSPIETSSKGSVYEVSSLRCSTKYTNQDNEMRLQVIISCSGSALKEYYK